MSQQGTTQFDHACDAALGWIARLRSDAVSEQDQQSFAAWLGEDHSHRQAMDAMLELWDDLGVVARLPREQSAPAEAANSARWYAGAAALVASLTLAVVFWPGQGDVSQSLRYQTAMGEQREVRLPDDSTVMLNTDTLISVSYREDERHVTLQRGEAWFQVAPNRQRPFSVDAGEARVTVLGTAFNVYLRDRGTDVTVTEGVVRVSELGETGARAPNTEILRERQQLEVSPDGWQVSVNDDIDTSLAWQRGELVAREMPLPQLIQQLERYQPTEILIGDPDLAVQTVSGVFQLTQPEAILSALELTLAVRVDRIDDNTVRLLKAEQ